MRYTQCEPRQSAVATSGEELMTPTPSTLTLFALVTALLTACATSPRGDAEARAASTRPAAANAPSMSSPPQAVASSRSDGATTTTGMDEARLASFVRARSGIIQACYENALKRSPGLSGRIVIRFTVLETGGLSDVTAPVNTTGSSEVALCLVNSVRAWRTPLRPRTPVRAEYPFEFGPAN